VIPTDPKDIKACEKKLKGICGAVVKWHKVDLQTGDVGVNPVEAGGKGWDKEGSLKVKGDSWASLREGETFKQEVTAEPGTVLHYFCAVHPFMQGEITVTD
jgi:plastocyanin